MQGLQLTQVAREGGESDAHTMWRGGAQREGRRGIRDSDRWTWVFGMMVYKVRTLQGTVLSGGLEDAPISQASPSITKLSITKSSEMEGSFQEGLMIETMADLCGLLAQGVTGHRIKRPGDCTQPSEARSGGFLEICGG